MIVHMLHGDKKLSIIIFFIISIHSDISTCEYMCGGLYYSLEVADHEETGN